MGKSKKNEEQKNKVRLIKVALNSDHFCFEKKNREHNENPLKKLGLKREHLVSFLCTDTSALALLIIDN